MPTRYERVATSAPTDAQLQSLAGTYRSGEAEVEVEVRLVGGALMLRRRPDETISMAHAYRDVVFSGAIGIVKFHRDATRVTGFGVVQDRVWDLRFTTLAGT
jgi:hypothetical protein